MSARKICVKPFSGIDDRNIKQASAILNSLFAGKVVVSAELGFSDTDDLELRIEFSDGSKLVITGVPCPEGYLCWYGDLDIKICADEKELELAKA